MCRLLATDTIMRQRMGGRKLGVRGEQTGHLLYFVGSEKQILIVSWKWKVVERGKSGSYVVESQHVLLVEKRDS